jgi:tetratricopeptide (TPR) repeat protein
VAAIKKVVYTFWIMRKHINLKAILALGLIFVFLVNTFGSLPAYAQDFVLPAPGARINLSPEFNPPILKGIKVHPDNPFRFDFILDKGDSQLSNDALKDESIKLIKYFLASLTIPEKDLWVNLSPYEKNRIVPESFGQTEMGRDLLAEDYMLKQITASLIYPEGEIGKKFWKRIYREAAKKFGTTNIPVNTFNKVWIVPEKAVVYENAKAGTAYVVESKLKVMLEQDYLAFEKNQRQPGDMFKSELQRTCPQAGCLARKALNVKAPQGNNGSTSESVNTLGSQIIREVVIPELTKEVNEDKNFTQLRQVYNSLILATWYKKKIKDSILEQVYADKNKVAGINIDDPREKQRIYERYLRAFKKGVFNYIKEEVVSNPGMPSKEQGIFPRKYFSGGVQLGFNNTNIDADAAMAVKDMTKPGVIGKIRSIFSGTLLIIMATLSTTNVYAFPALTGDNIAAKFVAGYQTISLEEGVIEVNPMAAFAYFELGNKLQSEGDLTGAIAAYNKSIELNPMAALTYFNLGTTLQSEGDFTGAIAAYHEAIKLNHGFAIAWFNLGTALQSEDDFTGAIAAYRKAVALDHSFTIAWFNLGVALQSEGDLTGAIAAYNKAAVHNKTIELKLTLATAYFNLGAELEMKHDLPGAIAAYNKAIDLNPDAIVYFTLGDALQKQGDLPGAIAKYEEGIKLDPSSAVAYIKLGNALQKQGDLPRAIAAYNEAIKLNPNLAIAYHNLGNALYKIGKIDESIEAYTKALVLDPRYAKIYLDFGNSLKKTGKEIKGLDEFIERARKLLGKSIVPDGFNFVQPPVQGQIFGSLDGLMATARGRFIQGPQIDAAINVDKNGGIDLTSDKALSIQNNGQGIKFHLNLFGNNHTNSKQLGLLLQQLQDAPGFRIGSITIQPLKDLSGFLEI